MLSSVFTSIMNGNEMTVGMFLLCSASSLILGLLTALVASIKGRHSRNVLLSLVIIPLIVQVVIMIVNGNIGVGLAVAGAFNLVRYRSNPGTASDILLIFLAMTVGLVNGMGYIWLAIVFALIALLVYIVFIFVGVGQKSLGMELKITIPESLNYSHIFDDIFEKYTKSHKLTRVKTTNLGSMYQLFYHIELKNDDQEKEMIDEIRCRNGNLDIICGMTPDALEYDRL